MMRGTNPPNPKAPQGDLYTEETNTGVATSPIETGKESIAVLPGKDTSAPIKP